VKRRTSFGIMARKGIKNLTTASARQASRRRRPPARWLVAAVASTFVVAAAVVLWLVFRPRPEPPTVVVFLLDTVRRDAVGCYGYSLNTTPNIDAVAADGVRFDRVVSTSGWTLPAVASLMTGTWPTVHGAMGRGVWLTPIRPELPMAAEILKGAGFATVGLANAAFVSPMVGMDRGFDVFDHRFTYNWDTRKADETIDAAIGELHKHRSEPCFYFIHLFDAHLDYDAPAEYTDRFTGGRHQPPTPLSLEAVLTLQTGPDGRQPPSADDIHYVRATYDAEVAFADANVGRFVDELKKLGLYDRSTIVITSDHGEEFWDHGGFEHGHTLHDELVLVPLVIKPPSEVAAAGRVVTPQVRLLDVMPTVFDILSVPMPASFEGKSLMPYIRGEVDRDLEALSESTLYGPEFVSLRGTRYAYILQMDGDDAGKGELFDWRKDPHETTNLAGDMPEVALELRTELLRMYNENAARAKNMSKPRPVDLSPARIRQLRSLGYIR
jgi:arylsulfatase A-like enzyme